MSKVTDKVDAIVVGSGITGGWAAKELAEAGLNTLLLEGGGSVRLDEAWNAEGSATDVETREVQPIQRECYACEGKFRSLFVSDEQHPYLSVGASPFSWIRGRHLGGRSLAWARTCFRLGERDFVASPGSVDVDWPIRYQDLEPWYLRVERWIGLSGVRDGLSQIPDSECVAPVVLNSAEAHLRDTITRRFRGERALIPSRVATLLAAHGGRPAYRPRSYQTHPIQDAAHFSSLSSTLPAAFATGKLTLRTDSIVSRVIYDRRQRRATGVEVVDRQSGDSRVFEAAVVVLAAGALESTRILLNSSTSDFPDGLANSSGCLGHYLMDHLTGLGAVGKFPSLRDAPFKTGRPATGYVPRFRNLGKAEAEFVGGYAFICDAFRPEASPKAVFRQDAGVGDSTDDWVVRLWGFGECAPIKSNRVVLSRARRDAWGIPVLEIDFDWSNNDRAMAKDMAISAAEMLEAAGASNVRMLDTALNPGLAIHEMGTARMGTDPKTSVVNQYGQCHDVPNLLVVDGATMPTSPCQNPSLTYMALASRATCHAIDELRKGNLMPRGRSPRLCLS